MADHGFNGVHRDEWVTGIKVSRLAKATRAKVKFHKSRVAYWTKEREKAHKAVVKKGLNLSLNPQLGVSTQAYNNSISNKVQTAEVDYKLIQHWQMCNEKVGQHKSTVRLYEKWVAFLTLKDDNEGVDNVLDLTYLDCEFFGLLQAPAGNE